MPTRERSTRQTSHNGHPLSERAAEVVSDAASLAQAQAIKASHRAVDLAKDHPMASLGITLLGGAILGAVAHNLFEHRPTMRELLADRVGVDRLRQRVRSAVCG